MNEKKTLFLGDSYTIGTGLAEGHEKEAFPFQLTEKLRDSGLNVAEPIIHATGGDTTKHLLGALNATEPHSNPENPKHSADSYDLVVLSIGVNDVFRGHSKEDYQHHFGELLQRSIRFAGDDPSKVMVLSIPAFDATPSVSNGNANSYRLAKYPQIEKNTTEISIPIDSINITDNKITISENIGKIRREIDEARRSNTRYGIARNIDSFNRAAKDIIVTENNKRGSNKKINFIDLTEITREGAMKVNDGKMSITPDPEMFTEDGIHYSGAIYEKWADHMLPYAKKALGIKDISPNAINNILLSARSR